MKKVFASILFFLGLAVFSSVFVVNAIDLTYPIASLGNCGSLAECRSYCDDPVNNAACVKYAKDKGFYKQADNEAAVETALQSAKSELGCDSEVSCRNFCEQTVNIDKCSNFAKKHKLAGGERSSTVSNIEVVAKQELGCDSGQTCKAFCEKEENKDKCSDFAKKVGLRGGLKQTGPGGCTSPETCRDFCADVSNYRVCESFTKVVGQTFKGPGGCTTEESCRTYCQNNPQVCQLQVRGEETKYNPVDMCNRTAGCYWSNNTCNCSNDKQAFDQDPASMCVKYSGCSWINNSCRCTTPIVGSTNDSKYSQEEHQKSCVSGGCKWLNNSCDCSGTNGPAMECGNKGCTWMNSSCQCGTSTQSTTSTSNSMSRDQQEYYCKAGGGNCDWTSGICNCKGYVYPGSNYVPPSTPTTTTTNTTSGGTTSTSGGTGGGTSTGSTTNSGGTSAPTPTPTVTSTNSNSAPSGMTREAQQAGCSSCGGTCNWNGDVCQCQCSNSGSNNQPTSVPPTAVPQAPAPTSTDPVADCERGGGRWAGGQCYPAGSVQGINTSNLLESFVDFLSKFIK